MTVPMFQIVEVRKESFLYCPHPRFLVFCTLKSIIFVQVLPGYQEPYPGWLDNVSSPIAIVGGCGKGILRVYIGPPHAPRAYVAVDMAINSIIVSTWKQAQLKGCVTNLHVMLLGINGVHLEIIRFVILQGSFNIQHGLYPYLLYETEGIVFLHIGHPPPLWRTVDPTISHGSNSNDLSHSSSAATSASRHFY